jgi:hypothetical protein
MRASRAGSSTKPQIAASHFNLGRFPTYPIGTGLPLIGWSLVGLPPATPRRSCPGGTQRTETGIRAVGAYVLKIFMSGSTGSVPVEASWRGGRLS